MLNMAGPVLGMLPPGSLTAPENYHPKRKVVFHPSFFRGYVKLGVTSILVFRAGEVDPQAVLLLFCLDVFFY